VSSSSSIDFDFVMVDSLGLVDGECLTCTMHEDERAARTLAV
jgi:hypothetical protein